ncbi:MAG: T9SS type A sorting domain-containing protein [Cryomorphaceae bacterium]
MLYGHKLSVDCLRFSLVVGMLLFLSSASLSQPKWSSTFLWDGQWTPHAVDSFTYTIDGNKRLLEERRIYSEYSNWDILSQYSYSYNASGLVTEEVQSEYQNGWLSTSQQTVLTYNENGDIVERAINFMHTTYVDNRVTYGYDANSHLIESTNYTWNLDSNDWKAYLKIEYENNANGDPLLELMHFWNEASHQWDAVNRFHYTYNGPSAIDTVRVMHHSNDAWVNANRQEIYHDAFHNIFKTKGYTWEGGQWKALNQVLHTINAKGEAVEVLTQEWDDASSSFEDVKLVTYEHHWPVGMDEDESRTSFQVYPNPARFETTVVLPQADAGLVILITDLRGKVVSTQYAASNTVRIDLRALRAGTYVLQTLGATTERQLLIKE